MKLFFSLFLALLGVVKGQRRLSYLESVQLQEICGILPRLATEFSKEGNGRRSIYNGVAINGTQSPWSVYLFFAGEQCSGALISPRHILTATHCLRYNSTTYTPILDDSEKECEDNDMVYTQDNNLFRVFDSSLQPLSSEVSRIVLINMCHIDNYRNDDLAILELYEDVQYSNFVRPICTVRNTDFEQLNKFVQVTGFGLSYRNPDEKKNITEFPVLRHGWLQIFDKSYSKNFFGAHNLVQQTGVRPGDSGGPGYIENGDRNYLMGITSIGSYLDMYFASVGIHANQICQHTGIC